MVLNDNCVEFLISHLKSELLSSYAEEKKELREKYGDEWLIDMDMFETALIVLFAAIVKKQSLEDCKQAFDDLDFYGKNLTCEDMQNGKSGRKYIANLLLSEFLVRTLTSMR